MDGSDLRLRQGIDLLLQSMKLGNALFEAAVACAAQGNMTKTMRAEIVERKDADGLAEFSGYASSWSVDEGNDRIEPGAFGASIVRNGGRVPLLWSHKIDKPIGAAEDLREDGHGLFFKGKLAVRSTQGKEAYELLKAGVLDGISIGFSIADGGARLVGKERRLSKLNLHEISLVSLPMNREARVVHGSLKGTEVPDKMRTWLEEMRTDLLSRR